MWKTNLLAIKSKKPLTKKDIDTLGMYVYRHKQIVFTGGPGNAAPMRKDDVIDQYDTIFFSKADYDEWYKQLVSGLAELDCVMNYCKYFIREKGNVGRYEREGKSVAVDGTWTGYEINCPHMKEFKDFIIQNGWENNWFELMDKYTTL